jgi:zinc protease
MLLKGTLTRSADEIAEASESLGVSLGASAGRDGFGWSLSVPTANFGKAVELFGEILSRPRFPASALETERAVALSNLALLRDDMYRYPVRLATAAAFAGHSYGIPVSGTEESLQALSVEHLRQWHEHHVLSSQMAIGIVGDLDPQKAAGLVAAALRSISYSKSGSADQPKWGAGPRMNAESRDKAQTALALAFPGPSRRDPTRFAGYILSTIASGLGGRFFEELRDKRSLAYTVNLSAQAMALTGMFVAYIATSPEKETSARDALLAEFERFREAPVTEDELARSKEYLIGSRAISRESGGAVLGEMLDAWLFGKGLDELLEHDASVRAVSAQDVRGVARACFHPEWVVEGVVRGSTSARSR